MILKYIGAILIFASCGTVGFITAANCRKEERLLSELLRILDNMQCELEYRLTPLPQICCRIAEESSGCLCNVFTALAQELENQIAPDAATCMKAAVSSVKDLPTSVTNALFELGNSLGKYDLDGQISEISSIKQRFSALLEHMRTNQDVRLRSYKTLGLCIGAGLAILFL